MTTDSTSTTNTDPGDDREDLAASGSAAGGARWGVLGLFSLVVIVVAVIAVGVFGVGAVRAYWPGNQTEQARDGAVAAAEQAMLNVSSIDPQTLDEWDDRLDGSFTGEARQQIEEQFGPFREPIAQAGDLRLTSRLVRSAPTEVDAEAGTAQVLVYVSTGREQDGQTSNSVMMSFLVSMVDEDGMWKASNVVPLEGFAFDNVDGEQPGMPGAPEQEQPAPEQQPEQEGGN